jgi:hypothetical protein
MHSEHVNLRIVTTTAAVAAALCKLFAHLEQNG